MKNVITISVQEMLQQLKLSCQAPDIIEAILSRQVIAHAAAEAGLKITTEELQQAADNLRLAYHLHSADRTWAWLEKHHLTLDEFEAIAHHSVLAMKLAEHLFADQVAPYFASHPLDYSLAVIYEVVLDDNDLAMELFYALQEDEMDFHEMAHQYAQDIEQRRQGGYLGVLGRADLKPEIAAAVFAAKPSQVLKPIVTSQGVHLILVEELIQPQLDDQLHQTILSDLFSEWLRLQVEQLKVTVNFESGEHEQFYSELTA